MANRLTWDDRFETLAAKGVRAQWSLDPAMDGDGLLPFYMGIPRKYAVGILSQLYYGELATAEICGKILLTTDEPNVRACLQVQIADERRHAEIYLRYINRVGSLSPVDDVLVELDERCQAWRGGPLRLVVAFHVVLEGYALSLQRYLDRWYRCPVLAGMTKNIYRDEARHVAFGKLYLRRALAGASPEERFEIYAWVKGMWDDAFPRLAFRYGLRRNFGLGISRRWLRRQWQGQVLQLMDIGLILPGESIAPGGKPRS